MRVRGLKSQGPEYVLYIQIVAPRAGAWIEMRMADELALALRVAPRAGAWIEIYIEYDTPRKVSSRTPCGCVD